MQQALGLMAWWLLSTVGCISASSAQRPARRNGVSLKPSWAPVAQSLALL